MYRFLTSFASSNVGGPEQLDTAFSSAGRVEQSSISLCSAEQPVISLRLKMSSIRDVQAWLNGERVASCSSAQAQRIKEAVALLSQPKPRQEDVRPLQSKWKVPREKHNKKKRLEDVIKNLKTKVIKAAQKLQQQLAGSAAQPAVAASSSNGVDAHDDCPVGEEAFLAELRRRQQKRATQSEAEEQRPFAKPKVAQRQNKRSACAVSGSVEQPAAKRKYQACADEPFDFVDRDLEISGGARSSSAAEHEQHRQRKMARLVIDLQKLIGSAWKAVNDEEEIERFKAAHHLMKLLKVLLNGPKYNTLMHLSIKPLYTPICGGLQAGSGAFHGKRQDFKEVWVIACQALEEKIVVFLAHRTDITKHAYPQLWELLPAAEDARLNSLPEMALSPEKLMQMLQDMKGENGVPFGRLPPLTIASHPNVFVRRLVCLELPGASYADLPDKHVDLIDKVVQHRRSRASDSAERPALITASDIKQILRDFSIDPWNNAIKKRWLFDILQVPAKSRHDDAYLSQICQTMVDNFMLALVEHNVTGFALSPPALAALALYHYILVRAEEKPNRCFS